MAIGPRVRVGMMLVLASCGPSIAVEDDGSATGADASSSSATTEVPVTGGPTLPPGSASTADGGADSSGAVDPTSTDDGDAPGCGFLCTPDAPVGACDLFTQNCPPGEKCMPWANDGGPSWNATRCSPLATNPGQVGESCMVDGSGVSGVDDCDIGLMCWNVDGTGAGVCEDMCAGSAELPICDDPGDFCAIQNQGFIALCLFMCHPLVQDCEIENEVCFPFNDIWLCAPDGQSDGFGSACEYINACGQGDVCLGSDAFTSCGGAIGCCASLCDLSDADADATCQALDPAQTCEPWYAEGQAPIGYADVGVCMIAGSL